MPYRPRKSAAQQFPKAAEKPQRRKIQSVERALEILEVLARSRGEVRLNDIARVLNLSASTCHHLISTLVQHGYAAQSVSSRSYFLGNKILELSGSRMRQFNLTDQVIGNLRELNERTGETVHLAVLQGTELVTLAVLDSRHPVRVVSGTTSKSNAIHATATGKAILAWLPEVEMDRILGLIGQVRFTPNTLTDRDALIEELRHVRRNQVAHDREEYQPGVHCIGAAIRNHTGAVIGAFSCSMPTMRASDHHLGAVERAVKTTARSISVVLGSADSSYAQHRDTDPIQRENPTHAHAG